MCPGLAEWWLLMENHAPNQTKTSGKACTMKCDEHGAKCKAFRNLGGSGGMPPQENFENLTL